MNVLALILARGGSKRIPKKNIAMLAGKPLIQYTIECAQASQYIDRIIVSTDDQEIAAVARKCGAQVPFMRPAEIAKEDSTELDAFKHALLWLKDNENYEPDYIVKLFPTSPLRTAGSVDRAVKLMIDHPEADAVRSVRPCSEHPFKMWTLEGKWLEHFIPADRKPAQAHTLSYQVLPQVYIQNAAIDVTKPSTIWKKSSITGDRILAFPMNEEDSVDINTPLDLVTAQAIIESRT